MAQALAKRLTPSLSLICNRQNSSLLTNVPKIGIRSVHNFARVGGVEIPTDKKVEYSLQSIYGIGRAKSRQLLSELSIDRTKLTADLTEKELMILRDEVSKYMIEEDLRRFNASAVGRLKEIECYRGTRHIQGLPCRGQRTKNNCRTLKGRAIALAGKKKPPR